MNHAAKVRLIFERKKLFKLLFYSQLRGVARSYGELRGKSEKDRNLSYGQLRGKIKGVGNYFPELIRFLGDFMNLTRSRGLPRLKSVDSFTSKPSTIK